MLSSLLDAVDGLVSPLTEIRHDIHQHPELGFEEVRTQKLVRTWLEARGYAPRACAETGLVADLHPDRVGKGRTIALRADLDCLPMPETTDLPYRSVHEGRAHKCGHDGHTVILMGVADVLARHRDQIPGNVRLLFQPAEEGVRGGGAKPMIEAGALEGVDEVYGLHNWPAFRERTVSVVAGPTMAQVHVLRARILGRGGHGSSPEHVRDPIVAGAHFVTALQTVVSRGLGHQGGAVVSIGAFRAGTTDNVIPGTAELQGTIRSFAPEVTTRVLERIREIAAGTEAMFGVKVELKLIEGYPALVNDAGCAEAVRRVASGLAERDPGKVEPSVEGLPIAGGEDFAYFTQVVPGAYFFLGSGKPGEEPITCHHPDFDFDDGLIPTGMRMFLGLVADRLGSA